MVNSGRMIQTIHLDGGRSDGVDGGALRVARRSRDEHWKGVEIGVSILWSFLYDIKWNLKSIKNALLSSNYVAY